MPASDIHTLTSPNSDAREAVTSAFEALGRWRDEVSSVNERYLTKALEAVASSQRSLGWSDQCATATRDYLLKASKTQTQMISQVMDAWEKQLKSSSSLPTLPEAFQFQMPPPSASARKDAGLDVFRLHELAMANPFMLWMQAAQMWQQNWADAMAATYAAPQDRTNRRDANRPS